MDNSVYIQGELKSSSLLSFPIAALLDSYIVDLIIGVVDTIHTVVDSLENSIA